MVAFATLFTRRQRPLGIWCISQSVGELEREMTEPATTAEVTVLEGSSLPSATA